MEFLKKFYSLITSKKRYIVVVCLLCAFFVYDGIILPYLDKWGSTEEERMMPLAGDYLVTPAPKWQLNQAITINGTPEEIYPYFAQMGQRKAGFYSYDWLERLFGFGIYNTYEIKPEWEMKAGDFCYFHKAGMGMRIAIADKESPAKALVMISDSRERHHPIPDGAWMLYLGKDPHSFIFNWSFNMIPIEGNKTRVIVRTLADWKGGAVRGFFLKQAFAMPSDVMCREMLLRVKKIVEAKNGRTSE